MPKRIPRAHLVRGVVGKADLVYRLCQAEALPRICEAAMQDGSAWIGSLYPVIVGMCTMGLLSETFSHTSKITYMQFV